MPLTATNRRVPRRHAPPAARPRRRAAPTPRRLVAVRLAAVHVVRRPAVLAGLAVLVAAGTLLPFALSATPAVSAASPFRTEPLPPPVMPTARPAAPEAQVGPGTPGGDSKRITLQSGGLERTYFLLPALGLEPGEKASLLVVLHQDVSSGREIARDLGLDPLRRHGVTLAYPNGFGGSWNSGACCGIAVQKDVDDVGFVNAVLDDVGRHTPVDPARRALLGYSGGGMLAYRLLCGEHPPLIAAVEINGSLEAHCRNGLSVPDLLSVHGEKDGSIGVTTSRFVNHLHMAPRSVTSTLATVTGQAGCNERRTSRSNGIELWRWDGCRGGGTVEAQIVPGAGHGWADVGGAERALGWLRPRLSRR